MKKTLNKTFFRGFVLLWLAAALINLLLPYRNYSENENRYLSAFPKFSVAEMINGKYMNKIETYLNDQFILRDNWISTQSALEYALGKRENNGVFIGKGALMDKIDDPDEDVIAKNISGINYFISATNLPASVMIVPSASEIQPYKLPLFAQPWNQKDKIDTIYHAIDGAACIDVFSALAQHQDEYIFYRTDHHWTTYGAYLAYGAYCDKNHLEAVDYSADVVSTTFNGTLYSNSGVRFMESDTIEAYTNTAGTSCDIFDGKNTTQYDSIYFPEHLDRKDQYAYFLGTNQPVVTLYSKNEKAPKLLILKDSYAHCMAPILLEHYSQITLVDLRYINSRLDDYFNISDYDNVLFLYSMDTFVNQNSLHKLTFLLETK